MEHIIMFCVRIVRFLTVFFDHLWIPPLQTKSGVRPAPTPEYETAALAEPQAADFDTAPSGIDCMRVLFWSSLSCRIFISHRFRRSRRSVRLAPCAGLLRTVGSFESKNHSCNKKP